MIIKIISIGEKKEKKIGKLHFEEHLRTRKISLRTIKTILKGEKEES